MAQSKELAALRLRLIRRGYTDVSIQLMADGTYLIEAIEPLGGMGVQRAVPQEEVPTVGRW